LSRPTARAHSAELDASAAASNVDLRAATSDDDGVVVVAVVVVVVDRGDCAVIAVAVVVVVGGDDETGADDDDDGGDVAAVVANRTGDADSGELAPLPLPDGRIASKPPPLAYSAAMRCGTEARGAVNTAPGGCRCRFAHVYIHTHTYIRI
jgi:hypothetical protein